jgi:hypothetical protein
MDERRVRRHLVGRPRCPFVPVRPAMAGVAAAPLAVVVDPDQCRARGAGRRGQELLRQPAARQRQDSRPAGRPLQRQGHQGVRPARGHRPRLRRRRAIAAPGDGPAGLGPRGLRGAGRSADCRTAARRALRCTHAQHARRGLVSHLHRRRPGEDGADPVARPVVPPTRRDAHHAHLQASAGPDRRVEARGRLGLRAERVALRADRRSARIARCENDDGDLRRPAGVGGRAVRPDADGRRRMDCTLAAGRFLPGDGFAFADKKYEQRRRPGHAQVPAAFAGQPGTQRRHNVFC